MIDARRTEILTIRIEHGARPTAPNSSKHYRPSPPGG